MPSLRLVTLKKRSDFQRVASIGRKHVSRFFVLQAAPQVFPSAENNPSKNSFCSLRIGFIITRKIGCAVDRNRIRRRFKAALQDILKESSPPKIPLDIVIIARSLALDTPFEALLKSFQDAIDWLSREF